MRPRIGDLLRNEEDRQRRIVFPSRHIMKRLLQAIDLCIANIRSVEEGEKV